MRHRKRVILSLSCILLALGLTCYHMALASTKEPYEDKWSLPVQSGGSLLVDVESVDVIIRTHTGEALSAVFEGIRTPAGDGTMPYIEAGARGAQISITTIWPKQTLSALANASLQGTLTILIPEASLSAVDVHTYSGVVTVENLLSDRLSIDTSNGNVLLKNHTLSGALAVSTFSGDQYLDTVSAKTITLSSSSGGITCNTIAATQAITLDSYSGNQLLQGVQAASVTDTASNGSLTLADIQGQTLSANTFSGHVTVNRSSFAKDASLKTSSGSITIDDIRTTRLEIDTFSGYLEAAGVSADSFQANTSSGRVRAAFAKGADVQATTFSGNVDLTFPKNTGITYTADSFSGRTTVTAPDAGPQEKDGNTLSGTIGDGTSSVTVSTSGGSLYITVEE